MKLNVVSGRSPVGQESYQPEMTRQAVQVMMQSHPLIPFLEFHEIIGDAEYVEKSSNVTGGTGRVKGTDFSASNVARDYIAPALKIFGDAKTIDQAEQRRGKNVQNFALRLLNSLSRNGALNLAHKLIHGSTSTSMWDGLAAICPAGQKIDIATNGAVIPVGNSDTNRALQQAFFEALDALILKVIGGSPVILVNSKLHARITNIFREAFTTPMTTSEFGVNVPYYNGRPFIPMGVDSSGNEILPFSETVGTSTTSCSSIYAVSIAEADLFSIATSTGLNVYFSKVNEQYRINPEIDLVPTLFSDLAMAKLQGLKLA